MATSTIKSLDGSPVTRFAHINWGTSIVIPFTSNSQGYHALVFLGQTDVFLLWNNSSNVVSSHIAGNGSITVARDGTTVTVTTPSANSITAIYVT